MSSERLTATERKAVSAADSRAERCRRFSLSEGQVRRIEQEGIDQEWPPLG